MTDTALDDASQKFMGDGTAGIQSVAWDVAKRKAQAYDSTCQQGPRDGPAFH